jgi:hypothetical protein
MKYLLVIAALIGFASAQIQDEACNTPSIVNTSTDIYQIFAESEPVLLEVGDSSTLVEQLNTLGFIVSSGFTSLWDIRTDDEFNNYIPMLYEATGEVIVVVFVPDVGVCMFGSAP